MMNTHVEDKEVSWKVLDISVYGTVTAQPSKEPRPAVIFVAGSGPTDRNWCSPFLPGANGTAKLLADALASQGFVTLRYDKLASGPRVRENVPKLVGKISMQSHLEELAGAVETLIAEENVDPGRLFVLTNSEGAIHAVNYQVQAKSNRFKGLLLTGAPGRSVGDLGRSQIFNQIKHLPNAEALMKPYDDAVADFLAGKPMTIAPSLPEGIKLLLHSLENPANLPFARELWTYRLSDHIGKIDEPVLVLIGKKDIQVDWRIDGGLLEEATAQKTSASYVYPENANHVLKHEEKPMEAINAQYAAINYNAPDAKLDEEAADAILNWLKKHGQP